MKLRYGKWLLYIVGAGLLSWYGYGYLFDTKIPVVQLIGIEDGASYAGDIFCKVRSTKNGTIRVALDGAALSSVPVEHLGTGEYQFKLATTPLTNGAHTITLTFNDNTFHKNTVVIQRTFYIDNVPLNASLITSELYNTVYQGHTVHIQLQTNKKLKTAMVHACSHTYPCVPEYPGSLVYECFVPIACEEQPNTYLFTFDLIDDVGSTVHLDKVMQIMAYPFKKQTLRIDQETIQRELEAGNNQKEFEALIEQLSLQSPKEKLWRGAFCAPTEIKKVTCEFGAIRTTQHKGRYAHKAVDVINYPKSIVWAPQDGRLVVKNRFAASGNTVVLDHGCGILSLFFHLDDFADINIGDMILQGNPLGTEGKTGFATGYHLHWEMRIGNIAVNPLEWIQPNF